METKKHPDPDFKRDIEDSMEKLKAIPGGRKKFYDILSTSAVMVRHWQKGTLLAKLPSKTDFYECVERVITEYNNSPDTKEMNEKINHARSSIGLN